MASGTSGVTIDSPQRAVQICLELLNSGVKGFARVTSQRTRFPVVMSITAPPAVVGGVLRSGAVPVLLDICPKTLNIDPELYKTAREEFGDGMATLFCEVGGQPIPDALLSQLEAHSITLLYSDTYTGKEERAFPYTFIVKDLHKVIDKGAVIFHDYEDQISLIYAARDGVLGHDAKLSPLHEELLEGIGPNTHLRYQGFQQLLKAFQGTDLGVLWDDSQYYEEFGIIVPDAQKAITSLEAEGFKSYRLVEPLHLEPMVAARYKEKASYPRAESLMNRLVAIPVNGKFKDDALRCLVNLITKEYNGQEGTD